MSRYAGMTVPQILSKMVMEGQPFDTHEQMNDALRLLGKWRSTLLANTYIQHNGPVVFQGPFAGMTYVKQSSEGALIARLLGTYESELHPYLKHFFEGQGVDCVIDVGCAEGYYAVGLARMHPTLTVYAYDIDAYARGACKELAEKNGVSDRVIIGERFSPADFQGFEGRKCLVMVDTEGAELEILDPAQGPALAGMNIIVETHDIFTKGALATLMERFKDTHDIDRVEAKLKSIELPGWFKPLAPMDHLLATWEWRMSPTPWLVMRPKKLGQS